MANGFLVIDEKDWENSTGEQRDWLIFKTLKCMDDRLAKLERRPLSDKIIAAAGGVIGGFLAVLGLKLGT